MRTYRALLAGVLVAASLAGPVWAAGEVKYASPEVAFEQGIGAYKSGYYEIAIPALTEAFEKGADRDRFFATFYLARIYSDNAGARTDHGRAYQLFQQMVNKYGDVDPDDGRRAPFVAKSMIAVAGYLRSGLPQINLAPDVDRANDLLQDAATIFSDQDAQFELAKAHLGTGATREDMKLGVHYLSTLTEQGHPGAQAYLADLYWRGRFVKKDELRALALVKMAVEHAPPHERVWIEDIYQNIFCGASQGTRKQAEGTVANWRKIFQRPTQAREEIPAAQSLTIERVCKGGEALDINAGRETADKGAPQGPALARPVDPPPAIQSGVTGFGIRGAGVTK